MSLTGHFPGGQAVSLLHLLRTWGRDVFSGILIPSPGVLVSSFHHPERGVCVCVCVCSCACWAKEDNDTGVPDTLPPNPPIYVNRDMCQFREDGNGAALLLGERKPHESPPGTAFSLGVAPGLWDRSLAAGRKSCHFAHAWQPVYRPKLEKQ